MEAVVADSVQEITYQKVFEKQRIRAMQIRTQPVSDRLNRLKKLKALVESHKQQIRDAVYADFKKPAAEADLSETYVVISEINHALKSLNKWAKPTSVAANPTYLGTKSEVQYEPKGTCLIIAPWNYPVNLLLGPAVSAIAAGNTVILKPSEVTAHTSALMRKLINENFPDDELHVIEGGVEETQALLKLPFDHIFFTGGTAIGKIIMRAAAENLTSVTLELGGKSPAIVDDTADIKDAAEKIAWGKWVNNGQTCIAPDYLLVHEDVKDEFLSRLKQSIKDLFYANGENIETSPSYSRIVSDRHFSRLSHLLNEAVDMGAEIVIGGQMNAAERLIEPTVLLNVPEEAGLMKEEIFGPILPVKFIKGLNEPVEYINSREKPLALYIFSKQKQAINQIQKATSSGTACVNDCVLQYMQPNLPFGGVNHSGIGKAHGKYGFIEFSNQKAVLKQRIGLTSAKSLYPPYNGTKQKIIDFMMKYI